MDNNIRAWKNCDIFKINWTVLQNRWNLLLQLEWSALQWTLSGRYFTSGHCYCNLNGVCYSEHYQEDISQVGTVIVTWMECVTVNIFRKKLHSRWTMLLYLEWSWFKVTLFEIFDHEDWTNMTNGPSSYYIRVRQCHGDYTVEWIFSTAPRFL